MSISYVQIGLILLALFLLVRMTQHTPQTTDKLSAAGTAVQPTDSSTILVHPNDTLGTSTSLGVWNGAPAQTVSSTTSTTAVATGTANGSLLGSAQEGLSVQPVDYDTLFNPKDIQPVDLIPKLDPALYPGVTADMDQNFLPNEIQAGLPTSNRRKYIDDIRPIMPNPITLTSPWGNPTTFPDITRRSICDL